MRMIWQGSLTMLLCAGSVSAAHSAVDQAKAVLSECSAPDLSDASVDSCLERVRVLDETTPSPALQSLEASLDEQKSGRRSSAANGPPRTLQPLQEETVPEPGVEPASSETAAGGNVAPPAMGRDEQISPSTETARSEDADPSHPSQDDYRSKEASRGSVGDDEPPVADPPDDAAPDAPSDHPE